MDHDDLIVGRYRLEKQIGKGGMGVVWLATDLKLKRSVAIKIGAEMVREGQAGARLAHPNVIAAFDVVKDGENRDCLVMEYLPSRSLRAIREEDGPLERREVAAIGAQIASALVHLHDRNMTHRDVTPANILVTGDRIAKLTDFGIASWASETHAEDPMTGGGTHGFQAPEVVRGNQATSESDVFSLGATLRHALDDLGLEEIRRVDPLDVLLAGLTGRDPASRPSAAEARAQLAALDTGPTRSRWKWWAVAAGVMVVVLASSLVYVFAAGDTISAAPPAAPTPPGPGGMAPQIMGDPRTADPCALTYANALSGYGTVETVHDYGNFNRCDALVYTSSDRTDYVDVSVAFALGGRDETMPVQQTGTVGIQRPPAEADYCSRILLLPDDQQVVIGADRNSKGTADLCGMADAITASALVSLNAGQIPRRALPAESLANRNACELLDTKTVAAQVGPGPVLQVPAFGNWECDWSYTDRAGVVKVVFDRTVSGSEQVPGGTALRLDGYAAQVQPNGRSDTDCDVAIVYRTYVEATRPRTFERVLVDMEAEGQPTTQLCAQARSLATTVAGRLSD